MNRPGPICPTCDKLMTPLFTSAVCENCSNPSTYWGILPYAQLTWTSLVYLSFKAAMDDYAPVYHTSIVPVVWELGTQKPEFDDVGRSTRVVTYRKA